MPTSPRTASVDPSHTVTWSGGEEFTGYFVIGVIPPTFSGTDFASVAYGNQIILEKLPKLYTIPIVEGKANQKCRVFYNDDIDPPSTKYICWLFDRNWRQVFTPVLANAFVVNTPVFTPTYSSPSTPTPGSTIPTLN
jgi:hypothetical protein